MKLTWNTLILANSLLIVGGNLAAQSFADVLATGELKKVKAQVEVLGFDPKKEYNGSVLVEAIRDVKDPVNRLAIVNYLMDQGAKVDALYDDGHRNSDKFRSTALISAIQAEDRVLVRKLLASGAKPGLGLRVTPYGVNWDGSPNDVTLYGNTYADKATSRYILRQNLKPFFEFLDLAQLLDSEVFAPGLADTSADLKAVADFFESCLVLPRGDQKAIREASNNLSTGAKGILGSKPILNVNDFLPSVVNDESLSQVLMQFWRTYSLTTSLSGYWKDYDKVFRIAEDGSSIHGFYAKLTPMYEFKCAILYKEGKFEVTGDSNLKPKFVQDMLDSDGEIGYTKISEAEALQILKDGGLDTGPL